MRFLGTVIGAAILIVLTYLTLSWLVDGYFGGNIYPDGANPDSWAAPNTWSEWRDIVIVLVGLFWLLAGALAVVLIGALIVLVFVLRRLVKDHAAPALDSLKESLDNVKGTTEFAGETVVSPIIRGYSVVRGVRSGVGAIGGLPDRIRRRAKGKK